MLVPQTQLKTSVFITLCLLAIAPAGCASEGNEELGGGAGTLGIGAAGMFGTAGVDGAFAGSDGSFGTAGDGSFAGVGGGGIAGVNGGGFAGAFGGSAGVVATAGTSGGTAGTTGTAGTMGSAGVGGDDGGGYIRGPEPTTDSAKKKGPYSTMSYTMGFRDGPNYRDATINYPVGAEPPFAGVAVVPGYTAPQSSIATWGPFLASHGIVTITIGTNSTNDQPPARAEALLDALETIKSENDRAGSPLEGLIDKTRMAVMGWSMGGGGTLIAITGHPELKAGISLCGWRPGGTFAMNVVPTMLIASQGDPLAGGQSQGFYTSFKSSTPKILFESPGANHNVGNNPANLSGEIGLYGLSWMKVFLEGDERYRKFLETKPTTATTDWRSENL